MRLERQLRRRIGAILVAALVGFGAAAVWADEDRGGTVHALLINGGSKPQVNYQSHLHHVEEMVDLLLDRGIPRQRIDVFSADGADPAADLARRESLLGSSCHQIQAWVSRRIT